MKIFKLPVVSLIPILMTAILGCAVSITQESAQRAIDDAYTAIETAKESGTDAYSPDNLKKAERFLEEAEYALSRNRRQRAYTLATKATETAKLAQGMSLQEPEGVSGSNQDKKVYDVITIPDTSENIKPDSVIPQPVEESAVKDSVTKAQPPIPQKYMPEPTQSDLKGKADAYSSDVQSRIKAAIQALDEAQKSVQAARLLMFKTQAEIGISLADTILQQVKQNNAPVDVVNMIQSRYDQALKAITAGKYEEAVSLIEQAQTYAQAFLK